MQTIMLRFTETELERLVVTNRESARLRANPIRSSHSFSHFGSAAVSLRDWYFVRPGILVCHHERTQSARDLHLCNAHHARRDERGRFSAALSNLLLRL